MSNTSTMPRPWVICWDQYTDGDEIIRRVDISVMTEATLTRRIEETKGQKKRIVMAFKLGDAFYRETIPESEETIS